MPLAPAARTMIDQLEAGGGPALWEVSVEDQVIPGPAGDLPVRIYTPDAPAPRPVMAFFHGGGFVICSVETHDGLARRLANAPGAAAEDCYAATQWVHEHAAALGADSGRLIVAGDSAGGNLAAVVTLMARERG